MNLTDETSLRDAGLESPRALHALEQAGFRTVADLKKVALTEIMAIKGVGDRTMEQIGAIVGTDASAVNDDEIEEGDHPLHLHSPYESYSLWVLKGDIVRFGAGKGGKIVPPVVIRFEQGRGRLTRDQYLARKYQRDADKIAAHINEKRPWRQEAAAWLKARKMFGVAYHLMSE